MATSSTPAKQVRFRPWMILLLLLAIVAPLGYGIWLVQQISLPYLDALEANNRGVGHMERFEFPQAVAEFKSVVRLNPNWVLGQINLGIGLMNLARGDEIPEKQKTALNRRATRVFQELLKRDPKNPYAHFCLGIMIYLRANIAEFPQAAEHFEAVTRFDDTDAAAWYWLGRVLVESGDPERAIPYFQHALKLDPCLNAALYALGPLLRRQNRLEEADALLKEFQSLDATGHGTSVTEKYWTDMGRYAVVIGHPELPGREQTVGPLPPFKRQENLQVQLAPGARWASTVDFGTGAAAELRSRLRKRFGATVVVLDYNRDQKPDLLLLGAVVESGQVRDLLLRNDGEGHFSDVTAEAGLGGSRPSLGCCVADFDNDGYPDLLITGACEQHLFHNTRKGSFVEVTAQTELHKLHTVCLGSAFVDLDQDGDLDLIVAQYADTPEHALARLNGETPAGECGLAVFINAGEAPPTPPSVEPPSLSVKFLRAKEPPGLLGEAVPAVSVAVTDVDLDNDLDFMVFADRKSPDLVLNDHLLRFHRGALPGSLLPPGAWNGALVLDAAHRERSDPFLVGPDQSPVLLSHQAMRGQSDIRKWFEVRATNAPALLQAQAVDIDLDGWTDIVGLSKDGKPILLHNDGHRLAYQTEALGSDADWPGDLVAAVLDDFDCDGWPDLMVWSETKGLQLHVNQGNGNHGLKLELTGHRRVDAEHGGMSMRVNADGYGAWAIAQATNHWAGAECTTLAAGLGHSQQPVILGLGRHTEADVIRIRWPDNTWQAELNAPPSNGCQIVRVDQINRKRTSCPILFAWNGQRFGFVTDFLGAGSIGESEPDGGHRPPRPEESVKIESEQLQPRDGQYILKIAEPMDEVTYLDRLQLVVLDHPQDVRVYPDERFESGGPPVTQDLLAFRQEIFPAGARDHRGRDVTATLRHWDRDTVHDFAHRSWLGFAEEHAVELDFGDRLAQLGPKDRLVMFLAGWTDYPYPESIWAAHQAGVEMQAPVLERRDPDGRWQKIADAGFPAGLPRMMTLDVTGKLGGPSCVLRLRTNLQIYWDQIFVAPLLGSLPAGQEPQTKGTVRATCLEVERATLSARGCMQELSPDGKQPTIYDYDRLEAVPVSRLAGRLTRFGDVTELLRGLDDRFVIFGPGDEVDVRFNARRLPELPSGWVRSYVLRTWGYCKDCAPFTDTGDTIEPLPFRAMPNYPYGPELKYPHPDYQKHYNTRQVGGRR